MFKKTGDAVVSDIFCSCGEKLPEGTTICPKCHKSLISDKAQQSQEVTSK